MKNKCADQLLKTVLFILLFTFSTEAESQVRVKMVTSEGPIIIKVETGKAKETAANFLRYVDSGLYDSAVFYRVVTMKNQPNDKIKIEVIQGGLFEEDARGFEPIRHERTTDTHLKHLNGTVSMARLGPGTASSEFFICIGSQPELDFGGTRNKDGEGFAAFGKVTKGMKTVKRIHAMGGENQYLAKPVKIYSARRL